MDEICLHHAAKESWSGTVCKSACAKRPPTMEIEWKL